MNAERTFWRLSVPAAMGLSLYLMHCGASDEGASGDLVDNGAGGSAGAGGGGGSSGSGGFTSDAGGQPPPPPPEQELESSFREPVATGRYVWAANPTSGRIALVDAFSLEVTTVEAGNEPTYLAALTAPDSTDSNAAIVLNVRSDDATLLRVNEEVSALTIETHDDANAWATSADGRWAIAWTDAREVAQPDPTLGFQDITVIDLLAGNESAVRLTVGYRPTSIVFDEDATRAFAVTEPGISVIDLDETTGPRVASLVTVSDDPVDDPASRDVLITPDGRQALVRREGSPDIRVVSLIDDAVSDVTLSGAVTDLDLSEDGRRAVAVVRENSQAVVLDVPSTPGGTPSRSTRIIAGETFGSVSIPPSADVSLLYTNAIPTHRVTILKTKLDIDFLTARTVDLKSPVRAVFVADDGRHAISFQDPADNSTKAGAFSVIPTAVNLSPKITGTDAKPHSVSLSADGSRAIVTVRDDAKKRYGVYVVRMPTLQVDYLPLASAPLSTGIVEAAGKAFVAQRHPEGRITFIDLADGSARTLTGFELGAKIVD